MTAVPSELSPSDRAGLAAGQHTEIARTLEARGAYSAAGWVWEQIWDWDAAFTAYDHADRPQDLLRVALESGSPRHLDHAMERLEASSASLDAAITLLKKRRRPLEAARLQARGDDPRAQAQSLIEGGDPLSAAQTLAEHGFAQHALELLNDRATPSGARSLAMTARVAWDLGDAEGAARAAQKSLRCPPEGEDRGATQDLLARALVALGHDLAAQIVLRGRALDLSDLGLPGRYQVQGVGPTGLVGASYVGIDRVTLEEVELHLLLADQGDGGPLEPSVLAALERFETVAIAATRLGHPAIRPIRRLDPHAGLLVLPRAEGPPLRSLIRPPGLGGMPSRVRGMIAFMLEGLEAAHARGLVHGWLLPSQIAADAAGRPMLGPFGAHHLAGLTATRTGSLEEILLVTAPEIRAGAAPHAGSDLYAVGALFWALLHGHLEGSQGRTEPGEVGGLDLELALRMQARDPADRPSVTAVLERLRSPVADLRDLGWNSRGPSRPGVTGDEAEATTPGLPVVASTTWSDALLDALGGSATPFMQPILDRAERTFYLAPWPAGSQTLGEAVEDWPTLLPLEALGPEDGPLRAAIETRLRPTSLVRTPGGPWMLALDEILTR